ncbi:MAG: alpha/beta hydrolase-fold protein, partial [Cyclobacteriaceae bacterium]
MKQTRPVSKPQFIRHVNHLRVNEFLTHTYLGMHSSYLNRNVNIDIFRPRKQLNETPVLFLNDGQDARQLKLQEILTRRFKNDTQTNIIVIGIHAGDRIHEYGVSHFPDYKNRGNKAANHESFIISELIPSLKDELQIAWRREHTAYAGFSLGGLSALDMVWRNTRLFSTAG